MPTIPRLGWNLRPSVQVLKVEIAVVFDQSESNGNQDELPNH